MIFTNSDGGARGNPGPGGIGVIVRRDGEILARHSSFIGNDVTSNVAEYTALIKALDMAAEIAKDDEITCVLDSELVVKQLIGEYRVLNPKLLELFLIVQKKQEVFKKVIYVYASREDVFQKVVDKMLNKELDRAGFKRKR